MGEETNPTGTSVNLGTIVREYVGQLQQAADSTQLDQFGSEQRFLERLCVFLDVARKQKDSEAEAYLKGVIQERLKKGNSYVAIYQQAQKTLDGVVEEAQVDEAPQNEGKKKHDYPKIIPSEVSEVISRYEQAQPQDTFSEREIIIILKHYEKLPSSYNYFKKLKYSGVFNRVSMRRNKGSLYTAESIQRFLTTINDLIYFTDKDRNGLARELHILSWQVSKLMEHESVGKYFKNLFYLLEINHDTQMIVYKAKDHDEIVTAMHKLVDSDYLKGVREATRPKSGADTGKVRTDKKGSVASKASGNGNGALLDFSGIEVHLGLTKGTIVGKPVQDKVERLLGMPQTPEKGDPGYPTAKVDKLKDRILALIHK